MAHGAAVIGRTFWTRVLARVTPDEDLDPALGTLEREHFVLRVQVAEPTYVYLRHEDAPTAPMYALRLLELCAQ